jgi:hypothetical protein
MPPVKIVVEQGVRVSGRVTDPDGNPIEGATVAPARTGSGNSLTGDTRYSVRTNSEGAYHVVLPASNKATYNLIVHDGDYEQWRTWANGISDPLQTAPGQKIEGFNLQLTQPATVRGRVVVGGRPVFDREVRSHDFHKRENRYYDPTTKTKEDGTFELRFVRPGKHYLQAAPFWLSAEDALLDSPKSTKIIFVKAGEVLEGIELVSQLDERMIPPETAALSFRASILDSNQKPVAGVAVGLGINGGVGNLDGTFERPDPAGILQSNEAGEAPLNSAVLGRVGANRAMIYAVDPEGRSAGIALLDLQDYISAAPDSSPVIDVVLEPAAQVTIEFDMKRFNEYREPPKLMQLMVFREDLPIQRMTLNEPGRLELWLPAGDYTLRGGAGRLSNNVKLEFSVETGQEPSTIVVPLAPSRIGDLIDKPAPEFAEIKSRGDDPVIKLAGLKGKVVVLDFWGHWCGPCVQAMPRWGQSHVFEDEN